MTIVYILGASIGFIGNRKWTFPQSDGKTTALIWRYGAVHLVGYLVNFMILAIFVDRLGFAHAWVQIFAIVTVALLSFAVFRLLIFNKKMES